GRDEALGIAVDAGGNAYVSGITESSDFPVTSGAYQSSGRGFLTKLNSGGTALVYSTRFGGSGYTTSNSVAIDGSGAAYVAGSTDATDLPVTVGGFPYPGGYGQHAFLLKFNATGTGVLYGTYIGGNQSIIPGGPA